MLIRFLVVVIHNMLMNLTYNKVLLVNDYNFYLYIFKCFEAWNNLAKCYVKIGNKSRAYYALKEAVKFNYENWMVWDNFMVVSVDLRCFENVSMHLFYINFSKFRFTNLKK